MPADLDLIMRRMYGIQRETGVPGETAQPEAIDVPPDEPGLLHTIGTILDTPGNAVRAILSGQPEKALHPFTQHVSGQDVNAALFGAQRNPNLFSAEGGLGLLGEFATDPLMLLGGLGSANKAGKAASTLGKHLGEFETAGRQAIGATLEAARPTLDFAHQGINVVKGGQLLSDAEITQQLVGRSDALGEAARSAMESGNFRPSANVGERINAGQADMLRIGGEYDPLGILRLPLSFMPGVAKTLPEIPLLTAPLHLPEVRLFGGAGVAQGIQNASRGVGQALSPLTNLFKLAPGASQIEDPLRANLQQRAVNFQTGADQAGRSGEELAAALSGKTPTAVPQAQTFHAQGGGEGYSNLEGLNQFTKDMPKDSTGWPQTIPQAPGTYATDVNGVTHEVTVGTDASGRPIIISAKPQTELEAAGAEMAKGFANDPALVEELSRMTSEGTPTKNMAGQTMWGEVRKSLDKRQAAEAAAQVKDKGIISAIDEAAPGMETQANAALLASDQALPLEERTKLLNAEAEIQQGALTIPKRMLRPFNTKAIREANEIAPVHMFDPNQMELARAEEIAPVPYQGTPESAARTELQKGLIAQPQPEIAPQALETQIPGIPERPVDIATPNELQQAGALGAMPSEAELNARLGPELPARPRAEIPATAAVAPAPTPPAMPPPPFASFMDRISPALKQAMANGENIPAMTPETMQAVNEALEHGRQVGTDLQPVVDQIKGQYEQWLEAEKLVAAPSTDLREGRLEYHKHLVTPEGLKDAKSWKKPEIFVQRMLQIEKEANEHGESIAPLFEQSIHEQRAARDLTAAEVMAGVQPNKPTGITGKQVQLFISRLPAEQQAVLNANPVLGKVLADAFKETGLIAGSQIPRLEMLSKLGIHETNKALGFKFFEDNPATLLKARGIEHAKIMAGAKAIEDAGLQMGREITDADRSFVREAGVANAPVGAVEKGISQWTTNEGPAFASDTLNKIRENKGLPPIVFDTLAKAKAVDKAHQAFIYPERTHELLNWYDKTTQVFKNYLTRAFPGFHSRNLYMGNTLQSYLVGVPLNTPSGEKAALAVAGREFTLNTAYGVMDAQKALDAAKQMGIQQGSFYRSLNDAIAARTGGSGLNPLDVNNKFLRGAERVAAGMAYAPIAASTGTLGKAFNITGREIEDYSRLRHFFHRLEEGWSLSHAAEDTNRALFDYSKTGMSDFEKNVMNRVVFFYGYTRNVIPLVAKTALEHIEKIASITRFGIQPGLPDRIPAYAREGLIVPRGKDEAGNDKLSYAFGTPVEAAVQAAATNPLTELNPIPRTALELLSGRDFFLHKDIADARNAPHYIADLPQSIQNAVGATTTPMPNGELRTEMNPYISYALRNNPLARVSNTASRFADERKSAGDSLLNLFLGPRTVSVDEAAEEKRAVKEAIKGKLDEEISKGGAYRFEEYAPTRSPEGQKTKELLKLLRLQSR